MILKNFNAIQIRRCVYCRGSGEENIFHVFGRYDDNPDIDFSKIIGQEVEVRSYGDESRGRFLITADESNPKMGVDVASLVGKKLREGQTPHVTPKGE